MRMWRRLDRWAARVNPGLAVVAAVLALVDGSIVLGQQATRPLDIDRVARVAPPPRRPAAAPRQDGAESPPAAKVAEARPSLRQIYAGP